MSTTVCGMAIWISYAILLTGHVVDGDGKQYNMDA